MPSYWALAWNLLYHDFPTKRDFFAEVVQRGCADMLQRTAPDPTSWGAAQGEPGRVPG